MIPARAHLASTLFAACLFGAACASSQRAMPAAPASTPSPLQGNAAPELARATLNGARFDLAASRGHVAIVKFVAKYCVPCQRSLPALERLHEAHPDLVVVAVAEDESEDDALGLVSTHHLTFPVIYDSGHVLGGRYRVTDLPVTFVVDRTGVVAWVGGPEKSDDDIGAAALATP